MEYFNKLEKIDLSKYEIPKEFREKKKMHRNMRLSLSKSRSGY